MLTPLDEPIDDLKDLTTADWDNLKDWEGALFPSLFFFLSQTHPGACFILLGHFGGKYIVCG